MSLPDPMTVEEGLQMLERLGQAVEAAKRILQEGPWRPSDENPQEVWGYPAHMVIGGHFVILDLERLQKAGLPEGTPGSRTHYTIEITAREKEACERCLDYKMVTGDADLITGVLKKIAALPKKDLANTPPPGG